MPRSREASDNVAALERGLQVLDCLAGAGRPLGNGDVAELTGVPRATVSRLLGTLVALGHVRLAGQGDKYELASGVVRLAQAFLGAIDVRAWARPHVAALAEAIGASSFLGVRDGDEMLVVEAGRSRSAVAFLGSDVGTRLSLASSALGRAWLIGIDEAACEALLAQWQGRSPPPAALRARLAEARAQGYVLSVGEWHPNINAAAVPVRTAAGEVVSLNCGGPAFVLSAQRLQQVVVPRLLQAAAALAKDIGGVAGPALTAPLASPAFHLPAAHPPGSAAPSRPSRPSPPSPPSTPTLASSPSSTPAPSKVRRQKASP